MTPEYDYDDYEADEAEALRRERKEEAMLERADEAWDGRFDE